MFFFINSKWSVSLIFFCLLWTVLCQQLQQFLAVPKDQQVVEGSTSILECEVANQRGRVQWAKDGFVLGKLCIFLLGLFFFDLSFW